ncbi:hypothetical protein HKCCE3408_14950 [Rhodobacterales bacterium HKCCE3408]|nr:hypothetical protein [Rhodobacterales bacterium HKCCE3408]
MRLAILTACAAFAAMPAVANEFEPTMRDYLESHVRSWAQSPVLIEAIRAMNAERAGFDQTMIDQMDQAWRSEVGSGARPTIDPIIDNPAADFLREQVAASGGQITEVFIMDEHGLNVAASALTSDMWQGDEDKFQMSYGAGSDGVHISDVELDESTQRYQGQISVTITDPETGEAIGAMTVGVDAESLL